MKIIIISIILTMTLIFLIGNITAYTNNTLYNNNSNTFFSAENLSLTGDTNSSNIRYLVLPGNISYLTDLSMNLTGFSNISLTSNLSQLKTIHIKITK